MSDTLFESEGFRWLFDATVDALLLVDDAGRIVFSNPAARQLFGYPADALHGQPMEILVPTCFRDSQRALTRGGTEFPVEISLSPLALEERTYTLATVRDITVRKNLERDILERRKEMDALHRHHIAAQTVTAIAHELNQPLLAIASYSKSALLMLEKGNPDLDKMRKAMEGSERQAQRAGQSIREMLDFLNMNDAPAEVFDLGQEIQEVLNAASLEHAVQVSATLSLEQGLPKVKANRMHIHKVLLNLLHNGIEAVLQMGGVAPALTVTAHRVPEKCLVEVTIEDNGPGIGAEVQKRLFDPFFTTKATGIGMGLAISRSLTEAHGGELWVEMRENPGARFHLTLPLAS
ncbi:MAG: two-component system sensor histidine kinase NtrB [Burkholderiales bacterium]